MHFCIIHTHTQSNTHLNSNTCIHETHINKTLKTTKKTPKSLNMCIVISHKGKTRENKRIRCKEKKKCSKSITTVLLFLSIKNSIMLTLTDHNSKRPLQRIMVIYKPILVILNITVTSCLNHRPFLLQRTLYFYSQNLSLYFVHFSLI